MGLDELVLVALAMAEVPSVKGRELDYGYDTVNLKDMRCIFYFITVTHQTKETHSPFDTGRLHKQLQSRPDASPLHVEIVRKGT